MFNDREKLVKGFLLNTNRKFKKETRDKLKYILEDIYQLEASERLYKDRLEDITEELNKRERDFEIALVEYWGLTREVR